MEKSDDHIQVLKLAPPMIRVDVDQERSKGSALVLMLSGSFLGERRQKQNKHAGKSSLLAMASGDGQQRGVVSAAIA